MDLWDMLICDEIFSEDDEECDEEVTIERAVEFDFDFEDEDEE